MQPSLSAVHAVQLACNRRAWHRSMCMLNMHGASSWLATLSLYCGTGTTRKICIPLFYCNCLPFQSLSGPLVHAPPGAGPAGAGALIQLNGALCTVHQQVAQHPLIQCSAEGDDCGSTQRTAEGIGVVQLTFFLASVDQASRIVS